MQIHHSQSPHGQNTISYQVFISETTEGFINLINVCSFVMLDQMNEIPDQNLSDHLIVKHPFCEKCHTPVGSFYLPNEAYPVGTDGNILHRKNDCLHENKVAFFLYGVQVKLPTAHLRCFYNLFDKSYHAKV